MYIILWNSQPNPIERQSMVWDLELLSFVRAFNEIFKIDVMNCKLIAHHSIIKRETFQKFNWAFKKELLYLSFFSCNTMELTIYEPIQLRSIDKPSTGFATNSNELNDSYIFFSKTKCAVHYVRLKLSIYLWNSFFFL